MKEIQIKEEKTKDQQKKEEKHTERIGLRKVKNMDY